MQLEAVINRLQLLRLTLPDDLPIAIPYVAIALADPCDSGTGSICAFGMEKLAAIQIAQCQVSQIQISQVPRICLPALAIGAVPEKCQFKSKTSAIIRFYVPRVVPPLR